MCHGMPHAAGKKWLRAGQPALTAWKKSAEGVVAAGETSRENHGGLTPAKARTVPGQGPNGARTEQYG